MGLVGKSVPLFTTLAAHQGKITTVDIQQLLGSPIVLFFYPLDFTFVCPTELHAFQESLAAFKERGVHVLACSIDSVYAHLAYLATPATKGGIEGIEYPLLSDVTKTIARSFGVLKEDEGIAYRGLFLIDSKGIIRHELINDLPLGRSVEEALRMVDALAFHEKNGQVCPANWNRGKKAMDANQAGVISYFLTEVK